MNEDIGFRKEFLDSLELLRRDVDEALVYSVHALYGEALRRERKQELCDELARFGKELGASVSSLNLKEITQYNIREKEKAFEDEAKILHGAFEAFTTKLAKDADIVVDRTVPFDMPDIAAKLGSPKLYAEFSFTRDKVDNLLSIDRLLEEIGRGRGADGAGMERKLDRQIVELKERAFNESLHSTKNRNQLYFFRSVALLNKFIGGGSSARIINDDRPLAGNDVGFSILGEDSMAVRYRYGGLTIEMSIARHASERFANYSIGGFIEKALAKIEFSVEESVSSGGLPAFERATGLDVLRTHYERAYADYQHSNRDSGKRQDRLNKEIVDKAIDDLLFD